MEDKPSDRVIDQRVRNMIMDAVETLAAGDDGVRATGFVEYFEKYYDFIRHRRHDEEMVPNSAITEQERRLLLEVSIILDDACDDTPSDMSSDEFIATGWPKRIQPVAQTALASMLKRGRFSNEYEEDAPDSRS
jgi:hypothetical protein